jgi:hypothetical protein
MARRVRFAVLIGMALAGCTNAAVTPFPTEQTPTPAPALDFPKSGQLPQGAHAATVEGISFTFEAPSPDWVADSGKAWAKVDLDHEGALDGLPDGAAVAFWNPVGVYADTCAHLRDEPVRSEPGSLVAAMADVPGVEIVSGPSDVTLGGLPAASIELAVPDEADCAPESLWLWYDKSGAWRWATALGDRIRIWIVDVGDARLVIEAETRKTPSARTRGEVDAIIESIHFE